MEIRNYFETVEGLYVSAAFDYFRIGREKWEFFLTRLAQMGAQGIGVRIPWGFHEIERGTIDLTGATQPQRNLLELLDLCKALQFQCLLQLGPYGNDDLLNKGLPFWFNPEMEGGELAGAIEGWYMGISQALVERQWPDGPLVLLQINPQAQPGLINPSQELVRIKWPIWLRKHYQGLEALNRAYGMDYGSVSEVDFPESWNQEKTPLEKDAKRFLAEVQEDRQTRYLQPFTGAGWQIPIQGPGFEESRPPVRLVSAAEAEGPLVFETGERVMLVQPIQVDPDPADIGAGLAWASRAPVRTDGSVRRRFWQLRADIWRQRLAGASLEGALLTVPFEKGGLIASSQDITLKLNLGKGSIYRLDLSGEARDADNMAVIRGKLSGVYLVEEGSGQTDFIFLMDDPTAPLPNFLATYLQMLLRGQAESLARCASLAAALGRMFEAGEERTSTGQPGVSGPAPYTLTEARRGLREADAILRKALASIGGLEAGFETMLGRREEASPKPAPAAAHLTPEAFEGASRDILIEVGSLFREIAPLLGTAASSLRVIIENAAPLRLEQYQQGYATAITTMQQCREPLLGLITRLRADIASESLPLVMWRAHDQAQSLAERLRWGVGRF